MKWIWPFCWYWRIRELEGTVARFTEAYKELDAKYRAEVICHTATRATLLTATTALLTSGAMNADTGPVVTNCAYPNCSCKGRHHCQSFPSTVGEDGG